MDVLYLREAEVEQLLTMDMALAAVEEAFRQAALGGVQNQARRRLHTAAGAMLHYMAAADDSLGYFGLKIYTTTRAGFRFLVLLYRGDTGALVALLEADRLGCVRTGAASGIASKYMARPDAGRVAILGSGHQAPTQLLALSKVRRLTSVKVFSRTPERRAAFAETMSAQLGMTVEAVATAEEALRGADLIAAITSAREPVTRSEWISPGAHINAAGINHARRQEIDAATVLRAARVVVDSVEQSKEEAGDLIVAYEREPQRWQQVRELSQVVAGKFPGRESAEEITLFKSNGVALEDVATAVRVYERALEEKVGTTLRMWD